MPHFLINFFNNKIAEKGLEKIQTETLDILPLRTGPPSPTFSYIHNATDGFDVDNIDSFKYTFR